MAWLGASLLLVGAGPGAPVRHEWIAPDVLRGLSDAAASPETRPLERDASGMPRAIERNGTRLEAPPETDTGQTTEMRLGSEGRPPAPGVIERPDTMRPDRDTGEVVPLEYHAVFNPEVAPMRRNVTFDVVGPGPEYEFSIADPTPVPIRVVGGAPGPGREGFYGDLKINVVPGKAMPLPSVAPDMRVLALRTEPPVDVIQARVARDGADNFYLLAEYTGTVRVVLFVDADTNYFQGGLPSNVPLDIQRGAEDTALPTGLAPIGAEVLGALRVDPAARLDRGLSRLVEYFRDFDTGALPKGGDLYRDVALGGLGVCRHRAFAFVLSARAAGLPARYVQNEAHAFAEVRLPDGAWRRVDLGGQAPSLDLKDRPGQTLHSPLPDAFPKPERYLQGYSARTLAGGGPGAPPPVGPGRNQPGGAAPAGPGLEGPAAEVPLPSPPEGETSVGGGPGEGPPGTGGSSGASVATLRRVRLALDGFAPVDVFRGEALPRAVAGVSEDDEGRPVGSLNVQVFLVPVEGGPPVVATAAARTDAAGRFSLPLRVPATLPLGRYRLVAASAQELGYAAARSDE